MNSRDRLRTFLVAPASLVAILLLMQPYERPAPPPDARPPLAYSLPVAKPLLQSLPTQQSVNWSEPPGLPCRIAGLQRMCVAASPGLSRQSR
jgi:hypothetical protein